MTSRNIRLSVLAFMLVAAPNDAQQFTTGIKVGGLVTDALSGPAPPPTPSFNRSTIGPFVELSLPHKFGAEFDALYKNYGYAAIILTQLHGVAARLDANISYWDFPLVLKWQPVINPV